MGIFKTSDGTNIYYKDQGEGQPIVFSHGWPLSSDDWDAQIFYFASRGYRCIAHDRRGHGRSDKPWEGHNMDQYADDLAQLTAHLGLSEAIHVGHSTGGGEVARYIGRHGTSRVAKAVLVDAVPPGLVQSDNNPNGLPLEVIDGLRAQLLENRAQFFRDFAEGPFYGFNRPGAKVSKAIADNWWRQGMMCDHKAAHDCIKAFAETDFTEDLKKFDVPTLVIHGEDDQVVPIDISSRRTIELVPNGTLKTYPGLSHGLLTINHDIVNAELLEFFGTEAKTAAA